MIKRTKIGLIADKYRNQKKNSKRRGHNPPAYSKQEIIDWAISQELYHELFSAWELSNWDKDMMPSIDRLEDDKPYTFNNIQLITWKENNKKGNDLISFRVAKYSLTGKLLVVYSSLRKACENEEISRQTLSKLINKGSKIWKRL